MLRLSSITRNWRNSGSLNANVNLFGFWDEHTFITKSGDLGMVLSLRGVDYESLDTAKLDDTVKQLEAALKVFNAGFHVYQYLFKSPRATLPFAIYTDPLIRSTVEQRKAFFESRRDKLYQIEIFYVIVLESARTNTSLLTKLSNDAMGTAREFLAQFSGKHTRALLRRDIERDADRIHGRVNGFIRQLSYTVTLSMANRNEALRFFRRLLNFDDWRIEGRFKPGQYLDFQVGNSDIEAERDHLRIGDHHVRVLTMKESVTQTRTLIWRKMLETQATFYACSEWIPVTNERARGQINARRKHANVAKTNLVAAAIAGRKPQAERDVLVDESMQADIEDLGECLRSVGDKSGHYMGDFSFTVVLYGDDKQALAPGIADLVRIFSAEDGNLFPETRNSLNALFACIPGNFSHNLRRFLMLNSNYADLSFLFTILEGEERNAHLDSEYLAILETGHNTPYFFNLHNDDVGHTLVIGATGSGKSFLLNFLIQSAQKLAPFTYIFDIGGSFESLTGIFSGSYVNVGTESARVKINPFSLAPTPDNLQFLDSFFRVLMGADRRPLSDQETHTLTRSIASMYMHDPEMRTLTNFARTIGTLKSRMERWVGEGKYGFLFDHAEDTLTFSNFQTFNFQGWNDAPDMLEALLFYVLHRSSVEIRNPDHLATFKMMVIDEAWHFIQNETIRNYIVQAMKTWRKHNAAIILATQSLTELEQSGMIRIIAESCPTKLFLSNPGMSRDIYADAFHLNDTELELISGLLPRGEAFIRKQGLSKKVRLNVDSFSYWMSTNSVPDNLRKREYFRKHGIAEGLKALALDHPMEAMQ